MILLRHGVAEAAKEGLEILVAGLVFEGLFVGVVLFLVRSLAGGDGENEEGRQEHAEFHGAGKMGARVREGEGIFWVGDGRKRAQRTQKTIEAKARARLQNHAIFCALLRPSTAPPALSVAGGFLALIIRAVIASRLSHFFRICTALSLAVLGVALAHAGVPAERRTLPDFDKRQPAATVAVPPEKAAAAGQLRSRLREARVEVDALSEAPQFVGSPHEFLTGPAGEGRAVPRARVQALRADEPHRELKAFLEEYRALFGHGAEALTAAQVKRDYTNAHNGLRSVVWQQQVDGVPVFEALLQSHVTRRGELVNVASHFLPDPMAAAARGTPRRAALLAAPTVSAAEAVAIAARNIGEAVQAVQVTAQDAPAGAEKKQTFHAAALRDATVHFTWLPMDKGTARLCWEVVLTGRTGGEMFRVLVDAETGETPVRHCLTNYISEATYRVFTGDSPTPMLPSLATPATTQPAEVARTLVTLSALDTTASPNGWIDDGVNETRGNNVDAHTDLDANNVADLPRPQGSPNRVFDFALDLTQPPSAYRDAAVTQLFYWCNWMHDKLYALGFNEASGNFQNNNFGRGGNGNDAVQADAQDGGGVDNANFSVQSDGTPGRMQMYVFSGPTPNRDGDLDASIILHEYTHGLSNRLVGGGPGISATASMGMGEGWSDFYALALLSKLGDDPNGNYIVGGYATKNFNGLTQNFYYGIRRYPYSTDLAKSPLTFKDIDPTQASTHAGVPRNPVIGSTAGEVHNVGEVWFVALWEARANLIAKYGFAGNQVMLQLVTDGMKLSPANPNFLQARDAIIQADLVNNAGANKNELWTAFAKRGMGASATAPASSTTTGVSEAYDLPDDLGVTPNSGLVSSGPVGGPFTVTSKTFTLKNNGAASITWTASTSATWLNFSTTAGTLAPNATVTVTATLNASANALPISIHDDAITFTNTLSTHTLTRAASLYVGQPDYFTELFDITSANDTANQTWTFTPTTATNSLYTVTRLTASAFPTDTSTGATLTLTDDSNALVTLTGGASVQLYGTGYTSFYVGSNGYITFGSGDIEWVESFVNHFSKPRISALFRDLDPTSRGTIKWLQLADRVAVTWSGVPEYGTSSSNNFQIEMFFDGRIRITVLAKASTKGLIGLSRGLGFPAGFVKSDFSKYPGPAITVGLPLSAAEGAGVLVNQGAITLQQAPVAALTVALSSSDPTAVAVPATVTIPAGQTTATFSPNILEDNKITGTRPVTISATAAGWVTGTKAISVSDNENTNLALTVVVIEEGGLGGCTVAISGTLPTPLVVSLVSANPARLTVPATVTIPAGSTSVSFTETAVENTLRDGSVYVTVTASAPGFTPASAQAGVVDNDLDHFAFSVIGGAQIRGVPFNVTVTAANVDGTPLSGVSGPLTLSASGGVTVTPAQVTLVNGTATVAVTAGVFGSGVTLGVADATAHTGVSNPFTVTYGPLHHFAWGALGATPVIGVPFPVTVTALDVVGNVVADFTGAAVLDCGTPADRTVPVSPAVTPAFVAGVFAGNVSVGQIIDAVTLRATAGAATGESGVFNVLGIPVLSVTPAAGFSAAGNFGGPFTPATATYTVTNTGTGILAWSVVKNVPWLTLSTTGGTLAAGAGATVTVGLDAATTDPGSHAGTVTFTNLSNALGDTARDAALAVAFPAPVLAPLPVFSGGPTRAVSWNTVAGAQTYEAQCSPDPGFAAPVTSGFIAATGFTFTGLTDGPHFYRVRARRVSGAQTFFSAWSPVLTSLQSVSGPAVIVTSTRLTTASVFTIDGLAYDAAGVQSITINGLAVSTTDGFAHWTLPAITLASGNNVFLIEALNNSLAPAGSSMTWNVYLATFTGDFDHDGLPDAWEIQHGLDLFDATGSNGALADLSGNGLSNLLKFAFGLDPYSPSLTGLPVVSIDTDPSNQARYLTLRHRRLLTPGPIQYVIEVSADFITWTSTPADFQEIPPATPNGDGLTETATIRVLPALGTPGTPAHFVRVRIAVP